MKNLLKFILRLLFVVGFITFIVPLLYWAWTGDNYFELLEDIKWL